MPLLYDPSRRWVLDRVQVNIPFTWLVEKKWLNIFIENRLNPEIGIDAAALDRFSPSDFADIARRFHDTGCAITLHGPFLDLSPGSPDSALREASQKRLDQTVAAAEAFSPKTVVCHAGYDPFRYEFVKETWIENAAGTWNRMARRLHRAGCRLMLENVYETRPEQLLDLFDKIEPGMFGCCLDIGHAHVFGNCPLPEWVEALAPFIGQLHLHDNRGKADQHLGLGRGDIDPSPLAGLISAPAPPIITLEPHEKEDLQASIRYLSNLEWFRRF